MRRLCFLGPCAAVVAAVIISVAAPVSASPRDFDGDGLEDLSVFDPTFGQFIVRFSSRLDTPGGDALGTIGDVPAPGDFNGDGIADQATFNRSTGIWSFVLSGGGGAPKVLFGLPGDVPVPARYSGFPCTDLATYNPQTGIWTVSNCRVFGPPLFVQFGGLPGDIPLAADWDGDGLDDLTVVHPERMMWRLRRTSRGFAQFQFGLPGDVPIPADYDGNKRAEAAVFRPSTNQILLRAAGNQALVFPAPAGRFGDRPDILDVDGDHRADLSVYHPASATFDITSSRFFTFSNVAIAPAGAFHPNAALSHLAAGAGSERLALNTANAQFLEGAVPGDFNRDLRSDFIFTRPLNGLTRWFITPAEGPTLVYDFGFANDQLLAGDMDGDLAFEPVVVRQRRDGGLSWFIRLRDGAAFQLFFGLRGDTPLVGDFDCDAKDDLAVVRPRGDGLEWFFLLSSAGIAQPGEVPSMEFGLRNDTVFAADFDGDRCDDAVVAQEFLGGISWFSRSLRTDEVRHVPWGLAAEDQPLHPMDVDGNGTDDPIVVRGAGGSQTAYLRRGDGSAKVIPLAPGGTAVSGYFSGITTAEIAVVHPPSAAGDAHASVHRFDDAITTVMLPAMLATDRIIAPGGAPQEQPVSTQEVQCDINDDFLDGRLGRLWKPVSEGSGNPVFLMPRSYWTRVSAVEVYNNQHLKILEGRPRTCCPNSNRAHYDIPRSARSLDPESPLTVRLVMHDGSSECLSVPVASERYD